MFSGTVPIHLELRTMKINPFEEEAQCSMRELAGHVARGDFDDYFGALAPGMDVWGIMIAVVHEDDDAIEATDDRHSATH